MAIDLRKKIASVQAQIERTQATSARLQVALKSLRELSRIQNSCMPVSEVARMLGVCPFTVVRMIHAGRLKGRRVHPTGNWFVTRRSLEQLAASVGQARRPAPRDTQELPPPA